MSKIDDGGPAFARPETSAGDRDDTCHQTGMSLRDYLAAHCPITLTEWTQGKSADDFNQATFMYEYASFRFKYADAMLKARKP